MTITFIGHSTLFHSQDLKNSVIKTILDNCSCDKSIDFYCGGYGRFDELCASACREIKRILPSAKLVFITPYMHLSQQEKLSFFIKTRLYDSVIYPPLETVPKKFAIVKRNEWMIREADLVIAYVNKTYGGAYKSLLYAKRQKKNIINLASTIEPNANYSQKGRF